MNTANLPPGLLRDLNRFVSERLGLHFEGNRVKELARAVEFSVRELGNGSPSEFAQRALGGSLGSVEWEAFVDQLTIGETYFLRDESLFQTLEHFVLPQITRPSRANSGPRRIWCAGCSTGEEPYSVAMTLRRSYGAGGPNPPHILATDINSRFLTRARTGVYGEWSFRRTPDWVKQQFFQELDGGGYRITSKVKEMVTFQRLNLVEDVYPSYQTQTDSLDLILCRNVLMYFGEDTRREVLGRLIRCLTHGGWLFVSPSETPFLKHPELRSVRFPGFFGFQRVKAGRKEGRDTLDWWIQPESGFEGRETDLTPRPDAPVRERRGNKAVSMGTRGEPRANGTGNAPRANGLEGGAKAPPAPPWEDALRTAEDLFRQGEHGEVIALLSPMVPPGGAPRPYHPAQHSAMALLARVHADLGSLQVAAEWCRKALRTDDQVLSLHLLLAMIQLDLGELTGARASLRTALYLDPDAVMARFQMGLLCRAENRMAEADRWMNGVVDLLSGFPPDDVVPHSEGMTVNRVVELAGSLVWEPVG